MTFRQDRPLHRRSLGGYLLLMQDQIVAHINTSGDGWLLPQDDPYKRDWPSSSPRTLNLALVANRRAQGFYFIAKSSPLKLPEGEAHLTYGIMNDALKGESFS